MRSRLMGAIAVAALSIGASTSGATAQPAQNASPSVHLAVALVGAAVGATLAVLLWPPAVSAAAAAVVPAVPAGAATVAPAAASWSWSAYLSTEAAFGALIGGAVGYRSSLGAERRLAILTEPLKQPATAAADTPADR
jgi:hypothetical protein